MSIHSSMSPKAMFNRTQRDQPTTEKRPLADVLKLARIETANCIRQNEAKKDTVTRHMVEQKRARLAEIDEQTRLMKAMNFDGAMLADALNIRHFERETKRLGAS